MANSALYLSVFSSLILVFALAVFLRVSYKHRRHIEALHTQLHDYSQRLAESFLQREIQVTEHLLRTHLIETEDAPAFERLRLFWLNAELAALSEGGRHRSDYDTLQKRAQPLLRLTRPKSDRAAATWNSSAALSQLQKVRATIADQGKSMAQHRQQTDVEGSAFTEKLDKVGNNNADLLLTISRLETELFNMQDKFNAANRQVAELQQENAAALAATQNQRAVGTAVAELRQSYRQTLSEMQRMRDINRSQRLLILQLEQELSNLRVDSRQYSASVKLLEKLKLQLRDYETCTAILEMETENLRKRLLQLGGTAQNRIPPADAGATAADAETHDRDEALHMLAQIISAETAERVGKLLIEWLRDNDVSAVLFIKNDPAPIWISSKIAVDSHSKQLLQGIVPVVDRPLVEIDEGIILAYPAARLLLHTDDPFDDKDSKLSQRLHIIMATVSHWLQMLMRERQNIENMRQQIESLLPQYDYMKTEQAGVCEKFKQEFTTFLDSANISSVQRQVVAGMFEDFAAELDILNQVSTLIRRGIIELLHNAETLR